MTLDAFFRASGGRRGGERDGERLRPVAPGCLWGSCLRHRARNAEAVTVRGVTWGNFSADRELWAAEVAPAPPASLNSNAIAQYR